MRRRLLLAAAGAAALASCRHAPAPAADSVPADLPRPTQRAVTGPAPALPGSFPLDPGAPLLAAPAPVQAPALALSRSPAAAAAPAFNPDPGAWAPGPAPAAPLFPEESPAAPAQFAAQPPPSRGPLERVEVAPSPEAAPKAAYSGPNIPAPLRLPREGVRENVPIASDWQAVAPGGTAASPGGFPGAQPVPDRWHAGFEPWRRYTSGDTDEMPFFHSDPDFWHYYRQSTLKGDVPIMGSDLFLRVAASADVSAEDRSLPVPTGGSTATPASYNFYGGSQSELLTTDFSIEADLFRGDTVFRPVDWLIHIRPVFDYNYVSFRETQQVSPSPGGSLSTDGGPPANNSDVNNPGDVGSLLGGLTPSAGLEGTKTTTRGRTYASLQEAFIEKHIADLSANYDFCAVEVGNQTFNSDFRGFVFNDTNLGARFFGTAEDNRWQYNTALFDLREKDTDSGLNTLNRRGELVAVANVYRQDTFIPGYTTELVFLASFDQPSTRYDTNGFLVRPSPVGEVVPHRVDAYYLGWNGDGHIGSWNISDSVYGVTGRDELNGIAGRPVDIMAGMAALELSYDRDWIRYTASLFYATGDGDPRDGRATGFDSVEDNANFTGGPFSYWVRQSFNLGGTSVPLKQRFSLLPDLRAGGAFEGQANFVNPGLLLGGVGAEADLTPKLRLFANANYLRFAEVDPLRIVLQTNQVGRDIGADLSLGVQWRPLLINNVVISAGCGVLLPSNGYRDIYSNTVPAVPGFTAASSGKVDQFLYSAILAGTFTY